MPPMIHNLLLVTQTSGGFDLTPIIGSGPIGAILALFIYMYREKDKQVATRESDKDKIFISALAEKDLTISGLRTQIDQLHRDRIAESEKHSDKLHAALTAMTEATRSLSAEVAVVTEAIASEESSPRRLAAQILPSKDKGGI